MIHVYVSMPERNHDVYQHVGSVTTEKLSRIACETLRKFGTRGRLTRSVAKLPILHDDDMRFYVLTDEHDREPYAFVDRNGEPTPEKGKP